MRLRNKYEINYLCTDDYAVYKKYKIANYHISSKSETCLAESKNSIIRRRLARFARRTTRFSKTIEMIKISLFLLFNEKLLEGLSQISIFLLEICKKQESRNFGREFF